MSDVWISVIVVLYGSFTEAIYHLAWQGFIYICICRKLEFPSSVETLHQYPLLDHLFLDRSCDSLKMFITRPIPKSPNLDSVSITKDHMSLAILDIKQCPKIVSFPERGLPLATPNLKLFVILDWKILEVIPNLRHSLSFLTELFIQECPKLVSTPGSFPETLRKLSIVSCHKFRPRRDWRLHKLENLRSLINIEDGWRFRNDISCSFQTTLNIYASAKFQI